MQFSTIEGGTTSVPFSCCYSLCTSGWRAAIWLADIEVLTILAVSCTQLSTKPPFNNILMAFYLHCENMYGSRIRMSIFTLVQDFWQRAKIGVGWCAALLLLWSALNHTSECVLLPSLLLWWLPEWCGNTWRGWENTKSVNFQFYCIAINMRNLYMAQRQTRIKKEYKNLIWHIGIHATKFKVDLCVCHCPLLLRHSSMSHPNLYAYC